MFGWPLPKESKLIAWSYKRQSSIYETGDCGAAPHPPVEVECVYIPSMKALATQWHPEWMSESFSSGTAYYQNLLKKYLKPFVNKNLSLQV